MIEILPRQLQTSMHGAIREELRLLEKPPDELDVVEKQWRDSMAVITDLYAAVLWHERREAHVIEVLRGSMQDNGGYGFIRQLLGYLGADDEEAMA